MAVVVDVVVVVVVVVDDDDDDDLFSGSIILLVFSWINVQVGVEFVVSVAVAAHIIQPVSLCGV